jgi:hypothetical protein
MGWLSILGKVVGSALLGLEEATQAYTNPATIPSDIEGFISNIIGIWTTAAASGTAPAAVKAAYHAHVEKMAALAQVAG